MKSDEHEHKKSRTATAVCTIARMNPPTPGHAGLIETMITKAESMRLDEVHIILSGSVDFDNPLEYAEKELVLERMITSIKRKTGTRINVHIKPLGKTPLGPIGQIAESTPDIHLVVGEDRKDDYNWLMRYLTEGVTVTVDALPRPEGAISATIVRRLARDSVGHDEHYHELQRIYGDYINDATLTSIITQVRERIEVKKKTKSKGKGRTRGKGRTKRTRKKHSL